MRYYGIWSAVLDAVRGIVVLRYCGIAVCGMRYAVLDAVCGIAVLDAVCGMLYVVSAVSVVRY